MEYTGKPAGSPTPMQGLTNQVDAQVMWQQMCYISADMKNLLVVSRTSVDLMKTMVEGQQKTTEAITEMSDRLDTTLDKIDVLVTGIGNLMIATQVLVEKMTELVEENRENTATIELQSATVTAALLDDKKMAEAEQRARKHVEGRRRDRTR